MAEKPFAELTPDNDLEKDMNGRVIEAGLLDRKARANVRYRTLSAAQLKG